MIIMLNDASARTLANSIRVRPETDTWVPCLVKQNRYMRCGVICRNPQTQLYYLYDGCAITSLDQVKAAKAVAASRAAAALGSLGGQSKSDAKKAAARKNLIKAAPDAESRRERAKAAAEARWRKPTEKSN